MTKEHILAACLLAGIEVHKATELPDRYNKARGKSWWLLKTSAGKLTVGPRSRVFELSWDMRESGVDPRIVASESVTKEVRDLHVGFVHAWSYGYLVMYLTAYQQAYELSAVVQSRNTARLFIAAIAEHEMEVSR